MDKAMFTVADLFTNEHGHVAKLVSKTEASASVANLGTTEAKRQITYYLPLTTLAKPKEQLIGTVIPFDASAFDVIERDYTIPSTGETVQTKWCYVKR